MSPQAPRAPRILAHRGASAEAPENTAAAFRRALATGVDGVELDVHLSSDGVPVVIHDPRLERTTDGRGLVSALPWPALRRLDAGRWFADAFAGERIPTLAEALALLRPVRVIAELKRPSLPAPGMARRVAGVIRQSGHPAVTVSSFDHPLLLEVRDHLPQVRTAVLYVARPVDPLRLARDAAASVLHPHWSLLSADVVEAAHAAGLEVETWVVDEPEAMARVVAMGVDGVMTNHPQRLRAVLARLGFPLPPPAGRRSGSPQPVERRARTRSPRRSRG